MAFKMKGPSLLKMVSALKNKTDKNTATKIATLMDEELDSPGVDLRLKNRKGPVENSVLKKDAKTGHGAKKFPNVLYTKDGTAKLTSQIDEELLDLNPSIDPKLRKFVNYTEDDGTKTKYYYKPPAGSRDKQMKSQGENIDEVD